MISGKRLKRLLRAEERGDDMRKKIIKFGIKPHDEFVSYTMAIAKGDYVPKRGEPKVWFESLKSFAQVMSNENQELLRIIKTQQPDSIKELAKASGRRSNNVSRTLKTFERYNIVRLEKKDKKVKPILTATDFKLELSIDDCIPQLC